MTKKNAEKILFFAANPSDTGRLRLDVEFREIQEQLRAASLRDKFDLRAHFAVRTADLRQALLDASPAFIHFSGHGYAGRGTQATEGRMLHFDRPASGANYSGGIALEDEQGNARYVDGAALARLFALFADSIRCILLNACYSAAQVQDLKAAFANGDASRKPIYVIGMSDAVPDDTAIHFATEFYRAIGSRDDIPLAFNLAMNALEMDSYHGKDLPELKKL